MTRRDILTLDGSARHIDANGFLHVTDNPVTREQVAEYWGAEIPFYRELGLKADKIYRMYRPAEELRAAAPTINRLPIYRLHQDVDAKNPVKEELIGSMGSDARFDGEFLRNSLCFIDKSAIDAIRERDMVELSLAYWYAPDMTPGTWQGQQYDGVMRQIMGNHLALVEEGRAGHDVAVRDAKPKQHPIEEAIMSFFKRNKAGRDEAPAGAEAAKAENAAQEAGQALMALQKLLPDGTVVEITDDEDKAAMIRELVERAGLEADLEPEQLKKLMDTLNDLAYSPATGDADGEDKCADEDKPADPASDEDAPGFETDAEKRAFEAGVKYAEKLLREPGEREKLDREHERAGEEKAAGDEEAAEKAADAARDAVQRLRAAMARAHDAARDVRPVLGDLPGFNPARDSAEKLYRRALDELGVNHAGVPDAAVRALYMAAQASGVSRHGMVNPRGVTAQDAAAMAPEFAFLKNIRKSY